MISNGLWSSGTLAHELGHTLGLRVPYSGHTLLVEGFGSSNLMWPYESDASHAPRASYSLGQVFRINLDSRSWMRMYTTESRRCDGTDGDRFCPALARDVAPLP